MSATRMGIDRPKKQPDPEPCILCNHVKTDTFLYSEDGHYVKAGNNREEGIRNSYEVWKDTD